MRPFKPAPLAFVIACAIAPGFAQADDHWNGFYVQGVGGAAGDVEDDDDRIVFDTNLDGGFGDTVNTAAGANAFSPGFCDGVAIDRTPATGCVGNGSDQDVGIRAGYDWQSDDWVYGVLVEYAEPEVIDAVSAFSTTPARYTMLREVDDTFALRGRLGMTLGEGDRGLLYGTAGWVQASIGNSFTTSNTVNTFTTTGDSDADGVQFGFGYEHRFGEQFTLGLEYLLTSLDDEDYRVRAAGPAAATNPFLLVNANGTDFARSDDDFDFDSLRLSVGFRF